MGVSVIICHVTIFKDKLHTLPFSTKTRWPVNIICHVTSLFEYSLKHKESMKKQLAKEPLPFLKDAEDAVDYWHTTTNKTHAEKALVIALMSNQGYKNRDIRKELNLDNDYIVSQLKRIGLSLTRDQLELWHENGKRITLGHVRGIVMMKPKMREETIRSLLHKKISVKEVFRRARGENIADQDPDLARFQRMMSDVIGRDVKLSYSNESRSGKITLPYYGMDDLDRLCTELGFDSQKHL